MEAHHFLITLVKWLIQSSEIDNKSLITIYPLSYTSINTASPVKRQKDLFLMNMVQGLNQRPPPTKQKCTHMRDTRFKPKTSNAQTQMIFLV